MLNRRTLLISLALALFTVPASAGPLVYVASVLNGSQQQFGVVDLLTGAFSQIGPFTSEGQSGLVQRPDGSLLTLGYSGDLNAIDPSVGIPHHIGSTGLGDCASPASPCGPTSAANLAGLAGSLYATDFSNNLYLVDPVTGSATLIGPTGIPGFTANPTTPNADGSFSAFDYSLFSAAGQLFLIFDVVNIDFATFTITPVIPANLYKINPATGVATLVAPTDLNLTAAVNVNGTVYAFNGALGEIVTLDLATGHTSLVSALDPAAGLVLGASPVPTASVPEPASIALAVTAFAGTVVRRCRARRWASRRHATEG